MILKDIINKSYYGSVGYISNLEDIVRLEQYVIYNLPVLKEFINVITSTTYINDNPELRIQLENTWKKYFPNSIHLDKGISRGHSFGAADNDNAIIDYCKDNNIDWVCKSANDIIVQELILEQQVNEADFYYMNGFGYVGFEIYDFDVERILKEHFYPQTNFYIINTSKIDYLNSKEYINSTFEIISKLPEYNGRIWEYIQGWSCEDFLKQCIERNNLIKKHLVSLKKYRTLLKWIYEQKIHDPSHKNIMIEGICHFHNNDKNIIQI